MFTLNCDRAYLHAHPERELTPNEISRYDLALAERGRGVPAQYITGHQEFWGMDLIVTPDVLIPRPETEHVIEAVLELAGSLSAGSALARTRDAARDRSPEFGDPDPPAPRTGRNPQGSFGDSPALHIADVGTGSGCIALALARELPQAAIHATDISARALEIARANAARHQLERRIDFHEGDLLAGLAVANFDFIVSNPPYVGKSEEEQVQLEVRRFEPRDAVFAGPTGLEVIARLIPQARDALKAGGWLVMEISGTIAERVQPLLEGWNSVEIRPDLQSIPRVVQARKP
jgi:release factor glutamine methyltransferase